MRFSILCVCGSIMTVIIVLSSCSLFDDPTAEVWVLHWRERHGSFLGLRVDEVEVTYKIKNTSSVDIEWYEVWIKVTCDDGKTFLEWDEGRDISAKSSDIGDVVIDIGKLRSVVSAEIHDYKVGG